MADKLTRRDFVCDSAVAVAGLAMGLTAIRTICAGNPTKRKTGKLLNYNSATCGEPVRQMARELRMKVVEEA
jgi:hypothetical protein